MLHETACHPLQLPQIQHLSDRFHDSTLQPTPTRLRDGRLHSTQDGRLIVATLLLVQTSKANNGLDPRLLNPDSPRSLAATTREACTHHCLLSLPYPLVPLQNHLCSLPFVCFVSLSLSNRATHFLHADAIVVPYCFCVGNVEFAFSGAWHVIVPEACACAPATPAQLTYRSAAFRPHNQAQSL